MLGLLYLLPNYFQMLHLQINCVSFRQVANKQTTKDTVYYPPPPSPPPPHPTPTPPPPPPPPLTLWCFLTQDNNNNSISFTRCLALLKETRVRNTAGWKMADSCPIGPLPAITSSTASRRTMRENTLVWLPAWREWYSHAWPRSLSMVNGTWRYSPLIVCKTIKGRLRFKFAI